MPETIVVDYNEDSGVFNFHIPGTGAVKEVTGMGKDEVKKIIKEVLPDAVKQLPGEVLHEVVQRVVIPVLSDVLKPLEKLMFNIGAETLEKAHDAVTKLAATAYIRPVALIEQAEGYSKTVEEGYQNPWAAWLKAMGVEGYESAADEELFYFEGMIEVWEAWRPFVKALKQYQESGGYSRQDFIDDFNKISFYIANSGNLSIGLYFNGMYDRAPAIIAELNKYKNTGVPATRHDIHEFITKLGPNAMDITASAKVELGISIGGSVGLWGVPTRLAVHFLDEAMEIAGVPA